MSGGWIATSGLSCRRTFGPAPWDGATELVTANGVAGPAMSHRKKASVVSSTTVAHPTTGSAWRCR